jgi:uncharacterized protein DUF5684
MSMNVIMAQVSGSGDAAAAGAGGGIFSIVWLVVVVAMIAAMWKIFTKAGQPGWAAIIPLYNYIVLFRITGKSAWWILGLMVPILNFYVAIRLVFNLASVFGRGIGFGFGLLFLFPIFAMILGFGDAVYVGPNGNRQPVAAGYAPAPLAP